MEQDKIWDSVVIELQKGDASVVSIKLAKEDYDYMAASQPEILKDLINQMTDSAIERAIERKEYLERKYDVLTLNDIKEVATKFSFLDFNDFIDTANYNTASEKAGNFIMTYNKSRIVEKKDAYERLKTMIIN